jgi:hypothetical protein
MIMILCVCVCESRGVYTCVSGCMCTCVCMCGGVNECVLIDVYVYIHDIMSIIMIYMSYVYTCICMDIVCMYIRYMVYLRIYKCGYTYIPCYKYMKCIH